MNSKVETFTANSGETFTRGTFNGISVMIRDKDGYINASKLGTNSKPSRHFIKSERFNQICQYWTKNRSGRNCPHPNSLPKYTLTNIENDFKGVYVHPDIIHFVAEWVDIEYSFTVSDIMNSINNKVHETLEKQHKPDTVENAKPVFKEIAKKFTLKIDTELVNKQCWGYRDDAHSLDSWEQVDLKCAIEKYNNIKKQLKEHPNDDNLKQQLNNARKKVDEWNSFVSVYHPEFQF
ncbi:hypothetical protein M9Y10_000052 [Tritrichomonas musculus]|uniref:KilA-N domain-containing protein n=1 Tax=Tritrichomonas musculus TaxID=1915356 RepID=A0ABR2L372_9EUKA